jgi:hypothetical protein
VENNKTKISIIFPNQLQYQSTMIKAVITGINIWLQKLQALISMKLQHVSGTKAEALSSFKPGSCLHDLTIPYTIIYNSALPTWSLVGI